MTLDECMKMAGVKIVGREMIKTNLSKLKVGDCCYDCDLWYHRALRHEMFVEGKEGRFVKVYDMVYGRSYWLPWQTRVMFETVCYSNDVKK